MDHYKQVIIFINTEIIIANNNIIGISLFNSKITTDETIITNISARLVTDKTHIAWSINNINADYYTINSNIYFQVLVY